MLFVDGSLFLMSLLYSLHSQEENARPFKYYFPPSIEHSVRALSNISENEYILAMILCVDLSGTIKAVKSTRFLLRDFYTLHIQK